MAPDDHTSRQAVEVQLRRMLNHPVFAETSVQAKVFEFLVNRALDGLPITQKDIREACFPNPPYRNPHDNIVRKNIAELRQRIPEYYATPVTQNGPSHGESDPIIITLSVPKKKAPPGAAYTPVFFYNPNSPAIIHFQKALLELDTPHGDFVSAIRHLQQGLELLSLSQAYGLLSYAIIELVRKYPSAETDLPLRNLLELSHDSALIDVAETAARRAIEVEPDNPFSQLSLCHLSMHRRDWFAAATAVNRAIKLDPQTTERHPLYLEYLLATGRRSRAIALARRNTFEDVTNALDQGRFALYLYLDRQYEAALYAYSDALLLDRNYSDAHFYYVLTLLALGQTHQALSRASVPPLGSPGLLIMCLTSTGDPEHYEQAATIFSNIKDSDPRLPLDSLLALIGMRQIEKAIEALEDSVGFPSHFLHLLPVLDPLRQHPRFIEIVAPMTPPQHYDYS